MRITGAVALVCSGIVSSALAEAGQTLNVYHVGNSVTDTINYTGLDAMAESKGNTHNWGRHMIPGAPLHWIWKYGNNANGDGVVGDVSGNVEAPYNHYFTALPNYRWDAITLQPFDRKLGLVSDAVPTIPGLLTRNAQNEEIESDIPLTRAYIDQALKNPANADAQVYIYSRWPRREDAVGGGFKPFDYQAKWDRTYTGGWDGTEETRDYFQRLTDTLNSIDTGLNKDVLMVPVGDVLYEMDKRMEAGQIPGFTDLTDFYVDGIHFNGHGSYVVGLTFYATLYKDSPVGLGVPSQYGASITPEQAAAFQDVVWDVVTGHPYSGVSEVPEPTGIAALIVGAGMVLARRRAN